MPIRGRLAFDDNGRLVEISESASDPTDPDPSEIQPVNVRDLVALNQVSADTLDATNGVTADSATITNTVDAGTVSTDEINNITDASTFSTFSNAVSNAQGGLLYLPPGDYDLANFGKLDLGPTDDVSVLGVPGDAADGFGTRLINTGSDRLTTGPLVGIDGDATDRRAQRTVSGLAIQNDASVAGFEVRDAPSTRLLDCLYNGLNNSQSDIAYSVIGESFNSAFVDCMATTHGGSGQAGWVLNHNGGNIDLRHCSGSTRTAAPSFDIKGEGDVQARGGQAGGDGIGIKMSGQGHAWRDPRIENADTAVQFGDQSDVANDCKVTGAFNSSIDDELLRVADGNRCEYARPRRTVGTTNGYVVDAGDDNVLDLDITASKRGFTDNGGRTMVKISETVASTASRGSISAKTPGTRVYVEGTGLQMWDGGSWVTIK